MCRKVQWKAKHSIQIHFPCVANLSDAWVLGSFCPDQGFGFLLWSVTLCMTATNPLFTSAGISHLFVDYSFFTTLQRWVFRNFALKGSFGSLFSYFFRSIRCNKSVGCIKNGFSADVKLEEVFRDWSVECDTRLQIPFFAVTALAL